MIALIIGFLLWLAFEAFSKLSMRRKSAKNNLDKSYNLFSHDYVESRAFYLHLYGKVPVISFVYGVDCIAAYQYVNDRFKYSIVNIYQNLRYSHENKRQEFTRTYFELENKMLIELGTDYAEILYSTDMYDQATEIVNSLAAMKMPEKKREFEINIITQNSYGLGLRALPIAHTDLDIAMYYNDDFQQVDELLRKRLNQKGDKGIVLLHGLPGTGKTTYLRYLIGKLDKRVLFMSPAIAGSLTNPDFVELLLDNPNCVLIIEDAENIIMDRKFNSNSAVANLLNIGDGLLSDCLSVQIICTFNSSLVYVDGALQRKGRLIAEYEFGKLSVAKAQTLSDHLNLQVQVQEPMTIAELTNADTVDFTRPALQPIGFKRQQELVTA